MNLFKKFGLTALSLATALGTVASVSTGPVKAAEEFRGQLETVDSVTADGNVVNISYNNGAISGKITLLENGIFRYNVDPSGKFDEYAEVRKDIPGHQKHTAKIQAQSDNSDKYSHPDANVSDKGTTWEIKTADATIVLDKATAKMSIKNKAGNTVMSEVEPLVIGAGETVQNLNTKEDEYFFGGGTQNGRFTHKGKKINIANESSWVDGGVSSPNPFYWSTEGYGVLRNTFQDGQYDFGNSSKEVVATTHNESEFDAYYFVSNEKTVDKTAEKLLNEYFQVTGNPMLLPEYAFYLAHLNCYNRDAWEESKNGSGWTLEDGKKYKELGQSTGYRIPEGKYAESLNNEKPTEDIGEFKGTINDDTYKFSARAVVDGYVNNDMPLGWFLPNDGYGCGYGQNGYYSKRGSGEDMTRMNKVIDANVDNLKKFTEYTEQNGVRSGLWTQAALTPETSEKDGGYQGFHTLRDFNKEVNVAGVSALKTDVAWVGYGYSMALNSVKDGYNILATSKKRPNLVSLDGWAGFQRYASIWTGDQTGGNWEYIRFHIPTYIGQSLAGNPNIGSDVDGIFGGSNLITTRDLQFKTFTQTMLDMDGWGSIPKKPYIATDPYKSINRMYLKLKAQLMPYIYTYAHESVDGLPMIRAMFLEEANDYTYSTKTQYQYMFGDNFLVAPVYQDTQADEVGNDVRNDIYLPENTDIWVDYFTGKQYRGGQVINNFDAPIWKLPLFVKNGSIIPMYEENNNPMEISKTNEKGLDKTRRVVEFYPYGETAFDLVEDDGISLEYNPETNDRNYGGKVETHITSKVEGEKATLTIGKSKGTYKGYDANRHSTFVVNVSKKPTSIEAKNGNSAVDVKEVNTYEEFQAAAARNEAVWFYDEAPNLNKYAAEGEAFKDTKITTTPKVYVSFTKTNVNENAQTLVVNGFANDGGLSLEQKNPDLAIPELAPIEEEKTPTSIKLGWQAVEGADSYELLVDGRLNSAGNALTYQHNDLTYESTHTYQIRSRNAQGYSEWSKEISVVTLKDPWRLTPKPTNIKWSGKVWGAHGPELAFDQVFQIGDGGFHSNYGGINENLDVDYGKVYKFDKLEYYPRSDVGNGTVTKMEISTSLDGVHWTEPKTYDWAANAEAKTVELDCDARFIRFVARESVGTFFSASEIKTYVVEGSKAHALGSTTVSEEVCAGDYTNMKNYLGTSLKDGKSFIDQVQLKNGDINLNGVYDVYDYAYTMFQLDGGTTKKGTVSGNALLLPSVETVKAGDTFTVDVFVDNAKNLNAVGQVIDYDPAKVEYVSIKQNSAISSMEDLTVNKVYEDGTAYVNMAFANRGDKELYNGSGIVATITMKAKQDITVADAANLSKVTLIGPDYKTIVSDATVTPEIPEVPSITKKYFKFDDFNITMTNSYYPEDDGKNVTRFVQGGSYDSYKKLFDGSFGREFEFLWDIESNYVDGKFPEHIKLPMTFHFDLKTPTKLNEVSVFNAAGATEGNNGTLKSAKAQLVFEDGTKSDEIVIDKLQNEFVFNWDTDKKVSRVDVTALTSSGSDDNHMLTLGEVQLKYVEDVRVEGIAPAADNATTLEVGQMSDIKAVVTPDNAPNKYFTATSSNSDVAKIITLADSEGHPVYKLQALKAGKTEITLTSAENPEIKVTYEVTVTGEDKPVEEVDKTSLSIAVEVAQNITDKDLENVVPVVVTEFKEALAQAKTLLESTNVKQEDINKSFERLASAMHKLNFFKGDKEALNAFVTKVAGLEKGKYIEATWTPFEKALDDGQKVLENENAMQEEVNEAYNNLVKAFLDLRLVPNKDALKDLISQAEALDATKYTDASWSAVETALANARAVMASNNVTQEEVDAACTTLSEAISGLIVNPAQPEKPEKPDAQTPEVKPSNKDDGKEHAVETGDTTSFASLTTLGLAALGLALTKKKKED